jgi:hypothetical protein
LKFENHNHNNNCLIELDDGREYLIYANWMHNQQIDNFKGWRCDAGVTRITIDQTGQIFSGECHNNNLGHLDTGWELLDESIAICKRDRCSACTDDLLIKKYVITAGEII